MEMTLKSRSKRQSATTSSQDRPVGRPRTESASPSLRRLTRHFFADGAVLVSLSLADAEADMVPAPVSMVVKDASAGPRACPIGARVLDQPAWSIVAAAIDDDEEDEDLEDEDEDLDDEDDLEDDEDDDDLDDEDDEDEDEGEDEYEDLAEDDDEDEEDE